MRNLAATGILLLTVLLFTGCGTSSAQPAETTAPTEAATTAATEAVTEPDLSIDEGATPLTSFEYELKDGYAVITDFKGKETEVVVTSHIGPLPVTEIGQYAFEAAWDVTSVTLPESVTFIGEQAFADCESLQTVNIPSGVTVLYRATFASCLSLETLTIPANVTETYEELLVACPLTDLYIENPALPYNSWGLEELETPCTIHAAEGAEILTWAAANGFPTEAASAEAPASGESTEDTTAES